MSDTEQTRPACPGTPDARVRRTYRVLHEALGSLIQQRPYERIVLKEILALAQVARSTFYTHFRDKDELLIHSMEEVLRVADKAAQEHPQRVERILAFSLALCEHIAEHRQRCRSGNVRGQHALHRKVEELLSDRIVAQLRREVAGGWQPPAPLQLLATHIAASFMRVLDVWIVQQPVLPAAEVDRLFRALVVPLLTSVQ
jgi:AcrR family transcriptional regulator